VFDANTAGLQGRELIPRERDRADPHDGVDQANPLRRSCCVELNVSLVGRKYAASDRPIMGSCRAGSR
jgi:hypothetical protein